MISGGHGVTGTMMVIGAAFLIAGFVKGVIGLGLPTVALGLLALVMRPAEAAALLVVPSLVTNLWQLASGPRFSAILRRLWPMLAGILAGTLAGARLVSGLDSPEAAAALGAALVLYAAFGLARLQFAVPRRLEPWLGPLVGAATGLVTAATGVFVIPAVPYLGAIGLKKDELIQALGLAFTVSTLALAVQLADAGLFTRIQPALSVLALAPALVGMAAGGWLRVRASPAAFRLVFFLGLLGLGLHGLVRALL